AVVRRVLRRVAGRVMTATKLAADQCSRHCITEHPIIDDLTLGRVWPRAPRDDHDAGGGIHIDVLAVNPHRHERVPPVMPGPPQVAVLDCCTTAPRFGRGCLVYRSVAVKPLPPISVPFGESRNHVASASMPKGCQM